MANVKSTIENAFMTYLVSQVPPSQLSDLYLCYAEIDNFFQGAGILKKPLFETTDIKELKKLRQAIERNQAFRRQHKKDNKKFVQAGRHYFVFIRDVYRPQPEQSEEPVHTIEEPESATLAVSSSAQKDSDLSSGACVVDFNGENDVAHTSPVQFSYFGNVSDGFSSWKDLYASFFSALCADYPEKFNSVMIFSKGRGRVDLSNDPKVSMTSPRPVPGTDFILETNLSANQMITRMGYCLDLCGVDYENVVITYCRKDSTLQKGDMPTRKTATASQRNPRDEGEKNNQEAFRRWLETSAGLSGHTADLYASAIAQCESFAQSHDYPLWRLYTNDSICAKNVIDLLRNDPAFAALNERQHHRFSAALSRFEQFMSAAPAVELTGGASIGSADGAYLSARWTPKFGDQVSQVLKEHYSYGYRVDSPIERVRFRNFAERDQISIPDSDDELDREIVAAGMRVDGKIYVFEEQVLDELKELVNRPLRDGTDVLFFDPFTEQNEEWLEEHCITSVDMVKTILADLFPDFYFAQNFLTPGSKKSEKDAVVAEVHRVVGAQSVFLFNDVCEQLPFIPSDKIAWCLSASDDFVWISEGKHFVMEYFVISERESVAIREFVANECRENGFASMADLPYGSIPEENYELSSSALYSAVYIAVLKPQYKLNGKILTEENKAGLDLANLLTQYCRERESCTLTEVMEQSQELVGAQNRQISFTALYDSKIRIDKTHFISDDQVEFDTDQIDLILQGIVGNRFAPLKSVTTFVLFPSCGVSWNHYLLESYCYRFSRDFQLCVMNFNDKNVGIIAAKSLQMSYEEMLCEAAANSGTELTPEAVGRYFTENGLMARKSFPRLGDILERAAALRERG